LVYFFRFIYKSKEIIQGHLTNFVAWLNVNRPQHGHYSFISKPDTSPLFENAWLAGFWDTDGSFDILMSQDSNYVQIRARLTQSLTDSTSQFLDP